MCSSLAFDFKLRMLSCRVSISKLNLLLVHDCAVFYCKMPAPVGKNYVLAAKMF